MICLRSWCWLTTISLLLTGPTLAAPVASTTPTLTRERVCEAPTPSPVTLQPGVNTVIAIARGHLNRLVTPFDQPRATTVSDATVQIKGRVVYVATTSDEPVTLFLTPEQSEAVALSLTLVPCGLPPRELTLLVAGGADWRRAAGETAGAAGQWETQQPYVDTLTQAFKLLALGRVPPGYNLRAWQHGDPAPPCAAAGVDIAPSQVVEGQRLLMLVALARNLSGNRVTLVETACAGPAVVAVAAWPQGVLEPGQAVEVYLALRRDEPTAATTPRPSLLGGY